MERVGCHADGLAKPAGQFSAVLKVVRLQLRVRGSIIRGICLLFPVLARADARGDSVEDEDDAGGANDASEDGQPDRARGRAVILAGAANAGAVGAAGDAGARVGRNATTDALTLI